MAKKAVVLGRNWGSVHFFEAGEIVTLVGTQYAKFVEFRREEDGLIQHLEHGEFSMLEEGGEGL